ncbi:MAG: nucleotidyl transferase AbiEii/AbiGii toxin family protein [Chloroflexi bacterium]|nr:nucleotidyl transferase AbiEii/AbiGii toxin family protein [Chloroflexota bacterium]
MAETVPLSTIHQAVLEFLRDRDDAALFGAQAVNAYVDEPRMTQDVDLLSPRAEALASELQTYLHDRFHIAVRVRQVAGGRGFRVFQMQKSGNRHLVDIRDVDRLPQTQRIEQILVLTPEELIASKVITYCQRRGQPKSGTDWRDLALLLLAFPELKQEGGPVAECLQAAGADQTVMDAWKDLVAQEISGEDDDW